MNVLCSGEVYNEAILSDGCIACAASRDNQPPCGFSSYFLRGLFAGIEDRTKEIHVSDLLGCALSAYLDKVAPEPRKVHENVILWVGIAGHHHLAACNTNGSLTKNIVELGFEDLGIHYRVDILDGTTLLDFKTSRWIKSVDNLPRERDVVQLNMYRMLLKQRGVFVKKMLLQYIDVTGPPQCRSCQVMMQKKDGIVECPICHTADKRQHLGAVTVDVPLYADDTIMEEIILRRNVISEAITSGIAPEAEPNFYCGWCVHSTCTHHRPR